MYIHVYVCVCVCACVRVRVHTCVLVRVCVPVVAFQIIKLIYLCDKLLALPHPTSGTIRNYGDNLRPGMI